MAAETKENGNPEADRLRDRIRRLECELDQSRQVQSELADYRDLWQSIVSHSADLIALINRQGTIEFISSSDPVAQESVGASGFEYIVAEQREMIRAAVARVFDTGEPISREVQEVNQGRWYSVRLSPLSKEGRIAAVIAICADITSRRLEEEEHREQSTRLRLLLKQLPAIVWTTDNELRFTSSTGAGLKRLGLRDGELVGKLVQEYFGTEDPTFTPIKTMLSALAGKSETHEAEWAGNYYQGMVEPLRNAEGQIEGMLGVALDITDGKRVEEELRRTRDDLERRIAERGRELRTANRLLRDDMAKKEELAKQIRESEERFRILAEASPVPVVISALNDGAIFYANERLCQLLGVDIDDLMQRSMREFYDDPLQRSAVLDALHRDGSVRDFELRFKRADGRRIWVSASFREIVYRGEVRLYAGLVDITSTKEAQESLKAERRLLKRLLDLHDRDRQLIAYEIHDGMVQDMTGSAMFVETAQTALPAGDPAAANIANGLKLLRGAIDEARRMINGLRPPILEDAGLVPALENFVDEMVHTADINIEFVHDVQFGRIAPALEMAVYRIVQEGINNVWQHSQARQAIVRLLQFGDEMQIVIEDRGIGFDPGAVRGKRYGLWGIRERARLLEGKARIDSSPGQGTRIEVILPLTDVLLPPDDSYDS